MKSLLRGVWWRYILPLAVFSLVGVIGFAGCAGGGELAEDEWGEERPVQTPIQVTIDSLQNEAAMAKQKNAKLEAEGRSLRARVAELETNLRMERDRAKALAPPPKPKITDTAAHYDHGLSLFRNGDYEGAVEAFMDMIDAEVNDKLADNVHYWLGESLYARRKYNEAMEHFNHVFRYRVSEKKDDAQLMIANCYARLRNSVQARAEYQKLIDNYPTSEYVERAREAMAKLR